MKIEKMKIIVYAFVCTAFILSNFQSYGQTGKIIRAGLNLSKLIGDYEYDYSKFRYGANAGFFVDKQFKLLENSVEVGIIYSQEGVKFQNLTPTFGKRTVYEVTHKLDYIIIPLCFKQMWGNLYTKFGPYGAYLLQANSSWKETVESGFVDSVSTGTSVDFQSNLRKYNGGLVVGAGLLFPVGRGSSFTVDFSYNFGLTLLSKDDLHPEFAFKTRVLQISIGLTMGRREQNGYYKQRSRR